MTKSEEIAYLRKLLEDIRRVCLAQPGARATVVDMIDRMSENRTGEKS